MEPNLKELTVKEALTVLAECEEDITGYFWDHDYEDKYKGILCGIRKNAKCRFIKEGGSYFTHFAIEAPDKYRYMTREECVDWACTVGYKEHQVRCKTTEAWKNPAFWSYDFPETLEYRIVQEVDGCIMHGEPQEFKVKV